MSGVHDYSIGQFSTELDRRLRELTTRFEEQRKLGNRTQTKLQKRVESLNGEIKDIERKNTKRIDNLRKEYNNKMQKQEDNLRKQLARQKAELRNELNNVRVELSSEINQINQRLSETYKRKSQISAKWVEFFRNAVTNINSNYKHNVLLPGCAAKLENRLTLVENNHKQENFDAAISSAQEGYLNANETTNQLEILSTERQKVLDIARHKTKIVSEFIAEIKVYRIEMDNDEGQQVYDDIDVEFWGHGELSKLEKKVEEHKKQLDNPDIKTDDIIRHIEELDTIADTAPTVLRNAAMDFRAHIEKQDIQEIIAHKLEKIGFFVDENVWENDDQRKKNVLVLKNGEDEGILITLDKQSGKPDIDLHWETDMNDLQTREERAKSVIEAINQELGASLNPEQVNAPAGDQPVPSHNIRADRFRQKPH